MASKKVPVEKALLERASVVVGKIDALKAKSKKFYDELDELAPQLKGATPEELLEHDLEMDCPFEKGNTQFGHGPVRAIVLRRPKPPKKPRKAAP